MSDPKKPADKKKEDDKKKDKDKNELGEKKHIPLDETDINLFKRYGMGSYTEGIKLLEEENK
jgi:hypothetical protein